MALKLKAFMANLVLLISFSTIWNVKTDAQTFSDTNYQTDSIRMLFSEENNNYIRPLAIKTNLLFDLATILNVEVELPLAPNWSVAGEWIFPWWQ